MTKETLADKKEDMLTYESDEEVCTDVIRVKYVREAVERLKEDELIDNYSTCEYCHQMFCKKINEVMGDL